MIIKTLNVRLISAIVFMIFLIFSVNIMSEESKSYHLDNGMEIILKEKHGSPMVASIVFVKSGSKYESKFENGVTHFLEHFLFDGTTSLTREELDLSIRDLGGYLNAFTRKELTAYLVLLPKQYIDYGMTIQMDMLFNSLIPEEELTKERKVVIEEINRSADAAGAPAEDFFTQTAYAGTPYDRPVLGFKAFIENIPREAIVEYWKSAYTPENMTALVIGDFDTEEMKKTVAEIFGAMKRDEPISLDTMAAVEPIEPASVDYSLKGQQLIDTTADVKSTYVNFSFDAPHISDSDYIAVDLLASYLGMDDVSPLMKILKDGADPLAIEAGVGLSTYEEFSRLEIYAIANDVSKRDAIVEAIINNVKNISRHNADQEILKGIKVSTKCNEIYNSDKLHYYGFMIAPTMMSGGWEFIQNYGDMIAAVNWSNCQNAAQKWFDNPNYIATVVTPNPEGTEGYIPRGITAEEVISHFDTVNFTQYNLTEKEKINFPSTDSVSFEIVDNADYHREVLPNGLTIIVKSRPDSRVFALNVFGKNRTANEPDGKAGITDFVNRCVEKGTVTRNSFELSRDLASIGANVTLYDNPWIPYDDRYTSRSYTFMKFETIDDYGKKGFHLFTEMILNPAFESDEVENVRQGMLGVLGRNLNSPGKVASKLFYESLFDNSVFSNPVMGSSGTIGAITVDDLKKHHADFYSPENMIISIVSNKSTDEVMNWINGSFGRLNSAGFESKTPSIPKPIFEIKNEHAELDKEQITIFLGGNLPGANSDESATLAVTTSILSSRLYLNLREKQGLAYSVGAGSRFDRDFGWYYCSIGTGFENYQEALDGILLQIDKLKFDGPTQEEIDRARNQLWGRQMSAKLSNINQAYYLCLDEFYGKGYKNDPLFIKNLSEVDNNKIRQIMSKYFKTDAYILTSAGKL